MQMAAPRAAIPFIKQIIVYTINHSIVGADALIGPPRREIIGNRLWRCTFAMQKYRADVGIRPYGCDAEQPFTVAADLLYRRLKQGQLRWIKG